VSARFDSVFEKFNKLFNRLKEGLSARDLRAPKEAPGMGHPLMRPVIQKAVVRVLDQICDQNALAFDDAISILSELPDKIKDAPWNIVFNNATGKMISNTDNTAALEKLIYVHLAPPTKEEIKRARKLYKDLKQENYPFSEDLLAKRLTPHEVRSSVASDISDVLEPIREDD
jgi:DNA sulfur modification protein DndB